MTPNEADILDVEVESRFQCGLSYRRLAFQVELEEIMFTDIPRTRSFGANHHKARSA